MPSVKFPQMLDEVIAQLNNDDIEQQRKKINELNSEINRPKLVCKFEALNLFLEYVELNILVKSFILSKSIHLLFIRGYFIPIPLLVRALVEIAATAADTTVRINEYLSGEKSVESYKKYIGNILTAVRIAKDLDGNTLIPPTDWEFERPVNILTLIDRLDKRKPDEKIRYTYDYLCEFCHPNYGLEISFLRDYYNTFYLDNEPSKLFSGQLLTLLILAQNCREYIIEDTSKIEESVKTNILV